MVGWGGGSGVSRLLMLWGIVGKTVHDLDTDLLGEGQLNSLASRGSQSSDTLLKRFSHNLDLWDSDTFLFREVLTANSWEGDWLVDTGLDWFRVCDSDSWLNNSDNGDIVASLLGDLLAVVVSISMSLSMAISVLGRLTDGHHLCLALLYEGNLNSLCGCLLTLRLVRVGADFIVDLLDALSADSTCDCVALLDILDIFAGEFNWAAHCFQSWGANFSSFNNILDGAVVLWMLIAIAGLMVGWLMVGSWLMVGGLRVGRLMVGGLVVGLSWNTSHEWHKN